MNPIDNILPPEGYASWLDFAVETFDTRGPSLERMIADGTAPARDAMREAARAELRKLRAAAAPSLYAGDPLAPLSAAEIGQVLGLDEQSVHAKANAGQLFSIRRSGHNYGQEFSAFQAWPGVTGEPLVQTLAALVPPGENGPASGTAAYGFLTSLTDLLGDLAPMEVLLGRQLSSRQIAAVSRALLGTSATERLSLVLLTARAIAASESA
jgi:hypothetical protein